MNSIIQRLKSDSMTYCRCWRMFRRMNYATGWRFWQKSSGNRYCLVR